MQGDTDAPPPAARTPDDDIDLIGVLDSLVDQRWRIALTAAVFTVCAAFYALLAEPQYQASTMIQVDDGDNTWASRSLLGDVSSLFDLKSTTTAETQVFASRLVVSRAAETLQSFVRVQPKRFPLIGGFVARYANGIHVPRFLGIGGYAWGSECATVKRFEVPAPLEGKHFTLTVLPGNRYRLSGRDLDASLTGVLGRLERFPTPFGPLVLEVERFDALSGTRFSLVRDSSWKTIQRIQNRLTVQEQIKQSGVFIATLRGPDPQEVSTLLKEIANVYIRQNIERKSAEAGQSLKFIYKTLPSLKNQFDNAENRYTHLRSASGSVDVKEEARLMLQNVTVIEAKLLDLRQKRTAVSATFASTHPDLVALDTQIKALESERSALRRKIDLMPALEQDLSRLWLDTQTARNLYTTLLTNAQQLELVKAGMNGNVRIVDASTVPEDSVRPKRTMIVAAAAMAGVVAGIALSFARDFLFGGLVSATQIKRHTGLHVLASVPDVGRARRSRRRAILHDAALDSLRELSTQLMPMLHAAGRNVVLIASPAPGAGASFLSMHLAAAFAAWNRRVLLVDSDAYHGELHRYFSDERHQDDKIQVKNLRFRGNVMVARCNAGTSGTLDFLSVAGASTAASNEGVPERIRHALAGMATNYDVVIIDAPPVLAAGDALELAGLAGVILLAARCGITVAGELTEACSRLARHGATVDGVILNGVRLRSKRFAFRSKFGNYRPVAYDYDTAPAQVRAGFSLRNLIAAVRAGRRHAGKESP